MQHTSSHHAFEGDEDYGTQRAPANDTFSDDYGDDYGDDIDASMSAAGSSVHASLLALAPTHNSTELHEEGPVPSLHLSHTSDTLDLCGDYECQTAAIASGSDLVCISDNMAAKGGASSKYLWTNGNGESWNLYETADPWMFDVGSECPLHSQVAVLLLCLYLSCIFHTYMCMS